METYFPCAVTSAEGNIQTVSINKSIFTFQLDKPVKQTNTVKVLKLGNTVKDPAAGTSCLVAGWGKTDNNAQQISDVLMSVNVTVIDRVKCNSPEYYGLRPVITSSMVCAGSDGKKSADTCQVRTVCFLFFFLCRK